MCYLAIFWLFQLRGLTLEMDPDFYNVILSMSCLEVLCFPRLLSEPMLSWEVDRIGDLIVPSSNTVLTTNCICL